MSTSSMFHALKERGIAHPTEAKDAPVWEARHNQLHNEIRDSRRNIEINIGKACNNRCVFCIDGLPKREDRSYMPWPKMQRELEQWAEAGHKSVGFLGGEPSTYPHIVEAVGYARELGFTRIALATNAVKLRLTHFTDKLLDAGLTRVTISMHAHTPELEARLTRVPKVFDKKVTAIRYLRKKKDEGYLVDGISVNPVITGWNYRYMPKMMKFFFDELDLDDFRANFMRPEGYAEGSAELSASYTQFVPYLMKCILLSEYHWKHKTFTFGGVPLCVLPRKLRNSDVLLRKYMGEYRDLSTDCSVHQAGKDGFGLEQVDKDSKRSRFNWQDRKRYDLKSPVEACGRCSKVALCEGIWNGYLHIHGDGEFRAL